MSFSDDFIKKYGGGIESSRNASTSDSFISKWSDDNYIGSFTKEIERQPKKEFDINSQYKSLSLYDPVERTADEYQVDIDRLTKDRQKLNSDYNMAVANVTGKQRAGRFSKEEIKADQDKADSIKAQLADMDRQIDELKQGKWRAENQVKYSNISSNADFEQKSKIIDENKAKGFFSDDTYAFINDINNRRESGKYMREGNADPDAELQKYTYMTQEEKDTYNYLYQTEGKKSAKEYLDYIGYDLDYRKQQKYARDNAEFATNSPIIASAESVPANLISGAGILDVAYQNAVRNITGEYKPINYNTNMMNPTNFTTAVRGTVSQNLADEYGSINLSEDDHPVLARFMNGKSLGDVYQLGMSMVDSGATAALGYFTGIGAAGTVLLGGSAGSQGVLTALEKGATDEQALAMGILNGTFEALFEYVSMDKLLNGNTKSILKTFLEQGFVEGTEEFNTTLFNTLADICVMAENSDYKRSVQAYMNQGLSPKDAEVRAMQDIAIGMGWDFIGGAISGGIMGGGKSVINQNIIEPHYYSKAYGSDLESLVSDALKTNPDNELTKEIQQKLENNQKVKGKEIRSFVTDLRTQDVETIRSAVEKQLTTYGETGDVTAISKAIAKQASGEELTAAEERIISSSKYGQRVVNELNPENIRSQRYNTDWSEKIGTKVINPIEYDKISVMKSEQAEYEQFVEDYTKNHTPIEPKKVEEPTTAETKMTGNATVDAVIKKASGKELSGNDVRPILNDKEAITALESAVGNLNLNGKSSSEQRAIVRDAITKYAAENKTTANVSANQKTAENGIEAVATKYGKQAGAVRSIYNISPVENVDSFATAFETAYQIGLNGGYESAAVENSLTQVMSEAQRRLAYATGKAVRAARSLDGVKRTSNGKGAVRARGMSVSDINKRFKSGSNQKTALQVLRSIAEATGFTIELFDSAGDYSMEQGSFDWGTDVIAIDIASGIFQDADVETLAKYAMLRTFCHEFTHTGEKWAAEEYNILRTAVIEALSSREEFDLDYRINEIIQSDYESKKAKYIADGMEETEAADKAEKEKLSWDMASREVVAEAMTDVLPESRFIKSLYEKDATLANKIKDALHKFLARVKAYFDGLVSNPSREAQALKVEVNGAVKYLEGIVDKWDAMALAAVENYKNSAVDETLNNAGIIVDNNTDSASISQNSVRYLLDDKNKSKVVKALSDRFGVTKEEAGKWLTAETSIASLVLNPKYSMYLDYEADPDEVAIKTNSDYPQGTVDFSPICKKRREFTAVMNSVFRQFPNHVFAATDLAKIRTIMGEEGMTLPCGICYVEDRRQLDSIVAQDFLNGLKLYREGSTKRPDGKPFNANQLKGLRLTDGISYTPSIYELVSLEGRNKLKKEHPEMEAAWVKYNNARGMQAVRLLSNEAEYKRQILDYNKRTVKSKNDNGGLRIYSFSDAEMFHLIDIIQIITDSSAVGLSIQGYTKVNEYAKAVRNTGEKLNRSLIPLGDLGYHMENGKVILDFDTVEGIDINSPDFFDNSDNPDIGNIVIGINDTQIRAAMVSPFIDQIIPFHTSQSEEVLEEKGINKWDNYKDYQTEKDISTGKTSEHQINIYTEVIQVLEAEGKTINKRTFVEKFLQVCKENGLTPRFSRFLNTDENGDYVYTEGYHKMLVDFKTFAQTEVGEYLPQMPVKPIFDDAYLGEILKAYVDEQKKKDASIADSMPKVVDRISNEIIKAAEKAAKKGKKQYSFRGVTSNKKSDIKKLATAQDMLESGIDSEKVRLATGWFKGYDGKWRYEIDDSGAKLRTELIPSNVRDLADSANQIYEESVRKRDSIINRLNELGRMGLTSSDPEVKQLMEEDVNAEKEVRSSFNLLLRAQRGVLVLSDILEHPKLYKAYPILKDLLVSLTYKSGNGTVGTNYGNGKGISFAVDRMTSSDILSTIMHEVQHEIQSIEGFAKGSNPDYWSLNGVDEVPEYKTAKANLDEISKKLEAIEYHGNISASPLQSAVMYAYYSDLLLKDKRSNAKASVEFDENKISYIEKRAEEQGYSDLLREYLFAKQDLDIAKMEAKGKVNGYDLYYRTAGEVEARDVQNRIDLTEKERKKKRPDIDRDNVVFVEEQKQYLKRVTDPYMLKKLNQAEREGVRDFNDIKEGDQNGVVKVYRAMQAQPVDENGKVIPNASVQRIVSYDPLIVEAKVFTGTGRKKRSEIITSPAKLFSPMAGAVNGVWRNPINLNEWEMSEGHLERATTQIDEKTGLPKIDTNKKNASYGEVAYYFGLEKGGVDDNGKPLTDVPARYNPYVHTSLSALNDQFSSGEKRPELVTVESLVPVFHINNGMNNERLPGAKDRVGAMSWHSGPTSSRLAKVGKARVVILSRYDKPIRVVPDSEVAASIANTIGDSDNIAIQGSTVTPSLQKELKALGVSVLNAEDWAKYAEEYPVKTFGNAPKFVQLQARNVNGMTYYSGGGLVDYALRAQLDHQMAVEIDEPTAEVYKLNNGDNIFVGDVRDFDVDSIDGDIPYFHASPVCKTYSKAISKDAKAKRIESEIDILTAQATADAIRKLQKKGNKIVTIENVKEYRGSDALKIITDALDECGYKWDKDMPVYNSADFGAATSRERLLIRAVKDGELPAKPVPTHSKGNYVGWYSVTSDLIEDLEEVSLPNWLLGKLDEIGIDPNNVSNPLYVAGDAPGATGIPHAYADKPVPTITANTHLPFIIMPDGRVLQVSPRMIARLQGLPDSYQLPTDKSGRTIKGLSKKIVGNGVPVQLTQAVFGPVLDANFDESGKPLTMQMVPSKQYQSRDVQSIPFSEYEKMENHFGTTKNYDVAGYLLIDGEMLDFSGKHWGDPTSTSRQVDHRDIQEVLDGRGNNGVNAMIDMIGNRNIRLMPETGGINLSHAPNGYQEKVLRGYINHFRGEIIVDVDEVGGDTIDSFRYNRGTSSEKILNDIRNYFNKGIKPEMQSDVMQFHKQYSVRSIVGASGKNYGIGVYLDSELLTNLTDDQRIEMVKEYVKELGGSTFTAYDQSGNEVSVKIAKHDQKFKNSNGRNVRVTKDLSTKFNKNKTKQESISLIDELITTSKYDGSSPAKYPHGWLDNNGKNDWDRWVTYLQDKENTIWEATLHVATSTNGEKYLYDIDPIKMVEQAGKSATSTTNPTVPQSSDGSQEQHQLRTQSYTDREVLEMAADIVDLNKLTPGERDALNIFGKRLGQLKDLQNQRDEQRRILAEQKSADTPDEAEIRKTTNRLIILGKKIKAAENLVLSVEDKQVLKKVLKESRKIVERDQRGILKDRSDVDKYRTRVADKVQKLSEKLLKNSDKEHIPQSLKGPLSEFLTTIDFSSKRKLRGGDPTKKDLKYTETLDRVRQVLQGQLDYMNNPDNGSNLDFYLDMPQGFVDAIQSHINKVNAAMKGFDSSTNQVNLMNKEQLQDLDFILTVISHSVNNINKLHTEGRFAGIAEAARDTILELVGRKPDSGKAAGARGFFEWKNALPVYAFKRYGEAGKTIFEGLQNGWDKLAFNSNELKKFSEKAYTAKEVNDWSNHLHTIKLDNGKTVKMTTAQIMSLYCLNNREQARGHIYGGGMRVGNIEIKEGKTGLKKTPINQTDPFLLSIADVTKILSELNQRQIEVAKSLQKYMSTVGSAWGNAVSMERFGYNSFEEKNYFPIESDKTNLPAIDPDAKANDMFRLLNLSMTKSLTPNANNALVVSNIFDVFATHMSDMAKYNALALPILDAMKWFNYKESDKNPATGQVKTQTVQRSIERAFGKEGGSYYLNLMKDLNGANNGGRDEGILNGMMSNYKVAAVAANLRVALLQPTAYFRASALLSPKVMAKAVTMKGGVEKMLKYSGIAVWKDLGFFDTNIGRSVTSIVKHDDTIKDKIVEKSLYLAELGDKATWGIIWNACELDQRMKGVKQEDLMKATAKRFRDVIYQTQVVDSTLTRTQFMRDKSVFIKNITGFMSEPSLSYNLLLDAYEDLSKDAGIRGWGAAWKKNGNRVYVALGAYAASQLAAAIAESIADAFRDDDDYETFLEKWLEAFWADDDGKWLEGNLVSDLSVLRKLPIIKDVIGYESANMTMKWIDDLMNMKDVMKSDKRTAYGKIYKMLQAVSRITGLPMSNAMREVATIWNNTIGVLTGNKLTTYSGGVKADIKEAYAAGHLTEEEAISKLIEKGAAEDENEAYWIVNGFDGDSKYTHLKDAIHADDQNAFNEAMDELTSNGVDEKTAKSHAKTVIGDLYKGTDKEPASISKTDAVKMLIDYAGLNREDAQVTASQWQCKVDNGFDYGEIRDRYDSGSISYSNAVSYLKKYGGKSDDKAVETVDKWKFIGGNEKYEDISASAVSKYNELCAPAGISKAEYFDAWKVLKDMTGEDNDGDGKTDAYSKMNKQFAYIDSLNLTSEQKTALALAFGIKETSISKRAPW